MTNESSSYPDTPPLATRPAPSGAEGRPPLVPPSPRNPFALAFRPLAAFFRLEAASGIVLLGTALAAIAWANFAHESYAAVFSAPVTLALGGATARFPVLDVVNDGLMTLFFFVVGMEIKRELVEGELQTFRQAILPAIAAAGGMLAPAAIFLLFNGGGPGARGWGIPMATDIAFCIGVLTLLKRRVPHALIVFVTALAIFDDIGGIVVIAVFYGTGIHAGWLLAAAMIVVAALVLARIQVRSGAAYAVTGVLLWYALHHSGVHATIAGVLLGLAIPAHATGARAASRGAARRDQGEDLGDSEAPLTRFVRLLHPWVAFGIMPLFALANSGVHLGALQTSQLTGRIAVGTAVALFVGKQAGIFAFTAAAVRTGIARIPGGASYLKLLGVSIISGIGFTVALFIAGLAYSTDPRLLDEAKVGVLAGSLVSGAIGALLLRATAEVSPPAH